MSRLQLLITGKSLVGLNDSESHYRLARERFLPQFGPVKNPFTANDTLEPSSRASGTRIEQASTPPRELAKIAPRPLREASIPTSVVPSKLPVTLTDAKSLKRKNSARFSAAAFTTKWAEKLRTLFRHKASKPAKVPLPSAPPLAVQGELSLDRIKVVRNDLSDADLEIVPRKSPTARVEPTPVLQVMERTAHAGMTWGRFSGLFGAGKR